MLVVSNATIITVKVAISWKNILLYRHPMSLPTMFSAFICHDRAYGLDAWYQIKLKLITFYIYHARHTPILLFLCKLTTVVRFVNKQYTEIDTLLHNAIITQIYRMNHIIITDNKTIVFNACTVIDTACIACTV